MDILLTCVSVIETNQRKGYFHVKIMKNWLGKRMHVFLGLQLKLDKLDILKQ